MKAENYILFVQCEMTLNQDNLIFFTAESIKYISLRRFQYQKSQHDPALFDPKKQFISLSAFPARIQN